MNNENNKFIQKKGTHTKPCKLWTKTLTAKIKKISPIERILLILYHIGAHNC